MRERRNVKSAGEVYILYRREGQVKLECVKGQMRPQRLEETDTPD